MISVVLLASLMQLFKIKSEANRNNNLRRAGFPVLESNVYLKQSDNQMSSLYLSRPSGAQAARLMQFTEKT